MPTIRYNIELDYGKVYQQLTPFSQVFIHNSAWPMKLKVTHDDLGRLFITLRMPTGERWKPPKPIDLSRVPEKYKRFVYPISLREKSLV